MASHSSLSASCIWAIVFGGGTRELTRQSRMPQRCSIGDMSGEKAGQGQRCVGVETWLQHGLCVVWHCPAGTQGCDGKRASNWIQNFVSVANPCQVTWNHNQFSPETCRYSTPNHDTLAIPAISLDHSCIRIMFSRMTPNTCSSINSWQTEPGFVHGKNLRPVVDGPIMIIASLLQMMTSSVICEHQAKVRPITTKPSLLQMPTYYVLTNSGVVGSRSLSGRGCSSQLTVM